MRNRRITFGIAAAAAMLLTAGCADGGEPAAPASASPTATASPTASAPAEAEELVFIVPEDCVTALPASRITALESEGLALLGGPGGKYGTNYLADPTPEESAGGITCIWGDPDTDRSSITVSVAPLGVNRPAIVQNLIDQGLNEAIDGDVTLYAVQGDEDHAPAILNVLRPDSWISVIQTVGGAAAFDEALTVADEAASVAYRPS